jgi:hypothetical protein
MDPRFEELLRRIGLLSSQTEVTLEALSEPAPHRTSAVPNRGADRVESAAEFTPFSKRRP